MMGERPERPKDKTLTDELWNLTQRCLEENPQRRPEITEVVSYLRILTGWQDCADVSIVDDMAQERELLYCTSSLTSSFGVTPIGLQDCSVHGYKLGQCCELERAPSEYGPASDSTHSLKPNECWYGARRVEIGGSDTHEGV